LALALLMVLPTISYARALTYPGSATWTMRTVDWVRGNGGGPLINALENWYYTRHKPSTAPPDLASLPQAGPTATPAPTRAAVVAPAPLPLLPGTPRLPGEAHWVPARLASDGTPALYHAFFRPDPAHPSIVAGVAWMRPGSTYGHLVAGTTQPGGNAWPGGAQVAPRDVPNLVATFNSGFKMQDITGGFYEGGRTFGQLVDGQASLVIDKQGNVTVGQWGRDVSMNSNVQAVRQNLALVVDGGKPVNGLSTNSHGQWGSPGSQHQYTWRSGIGIDATGALVYVAANNMDLSTLAAAMADAGIVRGMQLDIHSGMASFSWWKPVTSGGALLPTKLLPTMPREANRYINPDQRDFIYLTLR
jgi:hypothetical protein